MVSGNYQHVRVSSSLECTIDVVSCILHYTIYSMYVRRRGTIVHTTGRIYGYGDSTMCGAILANDGSAARDPHGIKQITVGPPHGIKQITMFIRKNVDILFCMFLYSLLLEIQVPSFVTATKRLQSISKELDRSDQIGSLCPCHPCHGGLQNSSRNLNINGSESMLDNLQIVGATSLASSPVYSAGPTELSVQCGDGQCVTAEELVETERGMDKELLKTDYDWDLAGGRATMILDTTLI
ncbi:hypothetical protein J6590_081724 [Homalodisca vitripennis]|nr:hypothetical protein J6590_081724 [Homalodisca vitripennis]